MSCLQRLLVRSVAASSASSFSVASSSLLARSCASSSSCIARLPTRFTSVSRVSSFSTHAFAPTPAPTEAEFRAKYDDKQKIEAVTLEIEAQYSGQREVKRTTLIAGLDVVPNGREVFVGLQEEIIASIKEYNAELKKQGVEEPLCNSNARRLAEHRLRIATENFDVKQIESLLWSGQIEELIEQSENELDCIVAMNEEIKPWEKPSEEQAALFAAYGTPNFGQDPDQYKTHKPQEVTKEEQQMIDDFWKPIDEEIRADQARELEERTKQREARMEVAIKKLKAEEKKAQPKH